MRVEAGQGDIPREVELRAIDRSSCGERAVLPFEDDQFDLVLGSHFLFTHADGLDQDFHYRALVELHRVWEREVRVFPLLGQPGGSLHAMTRVLRSLLVGQGTETKICDLPYEF